MKISGDSKVALIWCLLTLGPFITFVILERFHPHLHNHFVNYYETYIGIIALVVIGGIVLISIMANRGKKEGKYKIDK